LSKPEVISIDGVNYVKEGSQKMASKDGLDYVLIRGDRSGVFVGYLKSREGREVRLLECRRIWYWEGAASISQLATDGTSEPDNCKFPKPVAEIEILDAIEVIKVTDKAKESINSVSFWRQ
jgi:hypothetical protein